MNSTIKIKTKNLLIVILIIICLTATITALFFTKAQGKKAEVPKSTNRASTNKISNIDKNDWKLKLVNKTHKADDDKDLKIIEFEEAYISTKILKPLTNMFDAMKEDGLHPTLCSGYRSKVYQKVLFDKEIQNHLDKGFSKKEATIEAEKWVAVPGTSEHQLGLAVDILSVAYSDLDKDFQNSEEFAWLIKNAHKYGFILRYPKDKTDITKISYEPWHYRYVGIKNANQIYSSKLTLEEYVE